MSEQSSVDFIKRMKGKNDNVKQFLSKNAKPYVQEQDIYDQLEDVVIKNSGRVSLVAVLGIIELLKQNVIANQETE